MREVHKQHYACALKIASEQSVVSLSFEFCGRGCMKVCISYRLNKCIILEIIGGFLVYACVMCVFVCVGGR
jgi:hypothetical protein